MLKLFRKNKSGNPADTSASQSECSVRKETGQGKETRRISRLILCIVCLVAAGWQLQAQTQWYCGPSGSASVTATLTGGTLTVSGTGAMGNYLSSEVPWDSYKNSITAVVIEDGVTVIGDRSFYDCRNLTSVTISNSVTSIGEVAFADCSSLTSITMPNDLASIGSSAFSSSGLTSVTVPNSVTSIGDHAFKYCYSLTDITVTAGNTHYSSENGVLFNNNKTILIVCPAGKTGAYTIPNSVTNIGDEAFSGCSGLSSVTILVSEPPSLGINAFNGINSYCTLTVPAESENAYNVWSSYFSSIISSTQVWNCGPEGSASVTATFSNGTLVISGLGNMDTYLNSNQIPWDSYKYSITAAVIVNGVTSIAFTAFNGCFSLTSVTIPNSVTSIEGAAFADCRALTSVTIPNSVTSIGYGVFFSCSSLTDIIVEEGNTSYSSEGGVLFNNDKTALVTYPTGKTGGAYVIPNSVTSIGEAAFTSNDNLTSVTIPNGVTSINTYAFSGCSSLTSVTSLAVTPPSLGEGAFNGIPDGCTLTVPAGSKSAYVDSAWNSYFSSISDGSDGTQTWNCGPDGSDLVTATLSDGTLTITGTGDMENFFPNAPWYSDRDNITAVVIVNGVTSIGEMAFRSCINLASVTIPASVKSIGGERAFSYCIGLTSITIPEGVTTIGWRAFESCKSLTAVNIPASVTAIGDGPFVDCSLLNTITVESGNVSYSAEDGVLFNKDKTTLLQCPGGKSGTYTIPDGVAEIKRNAFSNCSNLTAVIAPTSVTSIGSRVFDDCSLLTDITVATGNTAYASDGGVVFNKDKTVLVIYSPGKTGAYVIPDGVTGIEEDAFYACHNLPSVTIPGSVTNIKRFAFSQCSSLTDVTCLATMPPSLGEFVFNSVVDVRTLTVPAGSKSAYVDSEWNNYFSSINGDGSSTQTWNCGPNGSPSVTATLSGGTLTVSGEGAMMDYELSSPAPWASDKNSITAVVIEDGVTSIGQRAFYECLNLTDVTIPASVTSIGDYAFYSCSSLTSVTCLAITPPSLGLGSFNGRPALTVPAGFESAYSAWSIYFSSINGLQVWDCGPNGSESSVIATLTDDGTLTISGTGDMKNYSWTNSQWERISPWSGYRNSITAVVIGDGVTSIGRFAFYECRRNLTAVTIPASVTSIGDEAFGQCNSLISITIPDGVTSIGGSAFRLCSSLTSITIPNSVTNIGYRAFSDCSNLNDITVEAENLSYSSDDGVLFNKDKTTLLQYPGGKSGPYTIPDGVTVIEDHAFTFCDNLTVVTVPASITSEGDRYAFSFCSLLTDITVATGNKAYASDGGVLFNKDKTVLITYPGGKTGAYVIPDGVTIIESNAFSASSNLTSVTIPGSVTDIYAYAFSCRNLTSVTCLAVMPPSLGVSAFYGIADGHTLTVPAGSKSAYADSEWSSYFSSISDGSNGTQTWNCGPDGSPSVIATLSDDGTLTISGTGVMEDYLAADLVPWDSYKNSITAAVIENGVTSIGCYAFHNCHDLTSVTIPNGVTNIKENAFSDCYSLTSITLPAGLTDIYSDAFYRCGLTSVTIPGSVIIFKYGAFRDCSSLTDIIVETGNTNFSSGDGVLFDKNKTALITYPAGKTGAYIIPGSVTSIVYDAFGSCSGLTSVTIPKTVTSIRSYAFADCTQLKDLTVDWESPLSIPGDVFDGTSVSTCTLHVPAGLEALYQAAPVWKDFSYPVNAFLTVSPSSLAFPAAAGSQTFDISSSVAWTVTASESWITVSDASGSGNSPVTVTAEANSTNASRTATVTVSADGIDDQTVTVTQEAPSLTVSPSSLNFTAVAGSQTFDISSNVAWTVSASELWVTVSDESGSGNGPVTVTVTANSDYVPRTATITVSADGIDQTDITITQEGTPEPASLTVTPSSFDFATAGGSLNVNVVSNKTWTASSNAPWLTVTQESASVLRIVATANTGYARMDSVTVTADGLTEFVHVTQAAAQQIIAEPTTPANSQGTVQIALEIPVDEQFSITFTVTLPLGFVLNQQSTSLVSDLLSSYQLSITPNGQGGWLFEITPALSARSGEDVNYREVIDIVYTIQETVQKGDYDVKIQNVDLTMNSGEVIHQDEINVPVRISNDVGNAIVGVTDVRYFNNLLYVNTPVAERIAVYTLDGRMMYQSQKQSGIATFNLHSLPRGVLIVRGDSGWVKKIVR